MRKEKQPVSHSLTIPRMHLQAPFNPINNFTGMKLEQTCSILDFPESKLIDLPEEGVLYDEFVPNNLFIYDYEENLVSYSDIERREKKILHDLFNEYQSREKLLTDPKTDEIYKAQAVARIASSKVSKKRKNSSVGTSPSAQLETQEAKIVLSLRRVPINILKMLEPVVRPKENSSSSTDSFDSDRAPMQHHRTYHRSSSPPSEVLKQTDVVKGSRTLPLFNTRTKFKCPSRNRAQQEFVGDGDNVIFYVGSALLGQKWDPREFSCSKEDLVLEVVGAIPLEDVIVDNVIPSTLPSLPLLAMEQTVVANAEEEDLDDYAQIATKVILSKLFSRFKRTPLDQLHSLSSFVDKTLNLLEGLPLNLSGIKSKVNGVLGKARLLTKARDSNSFDMLH
ncbi:hypothetical protein MRB53_034627 [Persea americana]|uniref:Uncharacterized protein n=1 Tax=Persea americana TaxID=3435 RepID=A0ACC2K2F8_PERAE|nr:hypothetical protein MRB53_034627 [Persea americana]